MYHINKESIGNGENITLQNTAKHYFKKFDILGNSKQETREGYNLCDFSNFTNYHVTNTFENDILIISSSSGAHARIYKDITDLFINNAGKVLYFDFESVKSEITLTSGIANIVVTNNEGINSYLALVDINLNKLAVTIPTDTSNVVSAVFNIFSNNSNDSTIANTITIAKPMLQFGTEEKPYEQYGTSPSIEYEAPIESVGDNINLLDNVGVNTTQNGIEFVVNEDKSVTAKGTATALAQIRINSNLTFPAGTYTIKDAKAYVTDYGWWDGVTAERTVNFESDFTITDIFIQVQQGETVNNKTFYPKISKGTSTGAYSPYGQGSIELYNCNKNFFDEEIELGGYAGSTGTPYNATDRVRSINKTSLLAGTYTISSIGASLVAVQCWNSDEIYNREYVNSNGSELTFTLENDSKIHITVINPKLLNSKIQIERGSRATNYTEHKSQTKVLYTQQPLRAIGDVKDRFIKKDGVWYEEHKILRKIFDGTENIGNLNQYATKHINTILFSFNLPDEKNMPQKSAPMLSNYFTHYTNLWHSDIEGIGNAEKYRIEISVSKDRFETTSYSEMIEEFKTKLSELYNTGNPLIVDIQLETPTLIKCTPEQVEVLEYFDKEIKSYDKTTNIYSLDIVSPYFDVVAYQRISEEFKTRLKEGKITRGYLKVLATNTLPEIIIDENNYLKDLKIEELRYVPEEGFIGGAVAKRVSGNFNNVDSSFNIQDREIEVCLGVELEDETTEYINYGTYIVQKPEDDQVNDNTSFEALDYMIKFNLEYKDRITYPCTLKQLFDDIVDQAGVKSKVITFPNADFIVDNNQFETGATLRDVLKAITQVAFNWSRIDQDNNLVMDFEIKETADEELEPDDYFNYKKTDYYGPVNTIILRNSQVEGENITIKNDELINSSSNKNICSNDWVYGQYSPENGTINDYENRIRQQNLLIVKPNTEYYINTFNENYNIIIRTYSKDKIFSRNLSAPITFETNENEYYIGVTIYSPTDVTSDLIELVNNNIIKPFICLNSEKDKTYIPFEANGEIELVISDNPFAYTQEKRQQLIKVGEKLYGLKYSPIVMDMIGLIYLNANDRIGAKNLNGEVFYTYLLNHTIDYTGVVLDSMESPAKTKTETKYQFMSHMLQRMKHTELRVDKAEQRITAVAQTAENAKESVSQLEITVGEINSKVATKDEVEEKINTLEQTIEGTTNKIINSGGSNTFYYSLEYWEEQENTNTGIASAYNDEVRQNTSSGYGYLLNKCYTVQKQTVKNGPYTISYSYSKLKDLATGYILINKTKYDLTSENINSWETNSVTINVEANQISIELHCDTDAAFYIADLMVAYGEEKQNWSQNANETVTDTVQIAKGIQVNSTRKNTYTRIDADGNRTYNSVTGDVVAEMTEDGIEGNKLKVRGQAQLNGILVQTIENQIWISSIL